MAGYKNVLGYDLNDKYCQISYYHDGMEEPETLEVAVDNYQIPLVLGYYKGTWTYGKEAKRLGTLKESKMITNLLSKALSHKQEQVGEEMKEGVWLLAKFIEMSIQQFPNVEYITFSVPELSVDLVQILKGIIERMGIGKKNVYIQDYKESFCYYMLYQPKELWQYESALFYCDREEVRAFALRQIKSEFRQEKEGFITVEEVSSAKMKELHAIFPVMNVEAAREADMRFKRFVEGIFDKKRISSVFLTGDGFDTNWFPESLKVMCNGRRVFMGNNLYSKGACYTAFRRFSGASEGPIYLDDTKMTERICIRLRANGVEDWFPIVAWGEHWYEADKEYEVLLENNDDLVLHVDALATGETRTITVSMDGLENRSNYSLRLRIETIFVDENTCRIIFKDVGFGDFFPETDFQNETVVKLGGSNGQFNSLP